MKKSGIVRRLDELGRIVVPKEIRKTLHIKEGTPLEINIDSEQIILKKYSPIMELGDNAKNCAECLYETILNPIFIVDLEKLVFAIGIKNNNNLLSEDTKKIISNRKSMTYENFNKEIFLNESILHKNIYVSPIIVEGDVLGAIIVDLKQLTPTISSNVDLTSKIIAKLAY